MKYRIPNKTQVAGCFLALALCWSPLALAVVTAAPSSLSFTWDEDTDLNTFGPWDLNDVFTGAGPLTFVDPPANLGPETLVTASVNPVTGMITFTTNGDMNGDQRLVFTAQDGDPSSDTFTMDIRFNPVDDAVDDAFATSEDTALGDDVSSNDTYTGSVSYTVNSDVTNGTLSLNSSGTFTYTPDADFEGVDSFTYDAQDVIGDTETRTVTITVNGTDDAQDDAFAASEDTVLNEDVSTNDSYTGAVSYAVNADVSNGLLVLASNGSFTYTPDPDFNGIDNFTYDATDVNGGVETQAVTVTVGPADDAQDDAFGTAEDMVLNGDVSTNDTYTGAVTYAVNAPAGNGAVAMASNGTFSYTPNGDFNGVDTFTYDATDVNSVVETQTVTITVSAADDAVDDAFATAEDTVLNEDVSSNDTYTGVVTYAVSAPASNGLVAMVGDGTFSYTPNADFNGVDIFTYDATDVNSVVETQTVTITVSAADDAADDAFATTEDTVLNEDVSTNDTYTGVVTYAVNAPAANGVVALVGDGTFSYTPNADFNGVDTFTYDATDVNSVVETQTVTITVGSVGDAQDDTFATTEDTVLSEDVSTNDSFAGAVTYTVNTPAANGAVAMAGDGTFTYTPNADFNGFDSFTYDATDVNAAVETRTVSITVGAVDDAVDDAFAATEDTVLNEDVSSNDNFAGAVTYTVGTAATNGLVALATNGTFTYTPNADFNGVDTFTYDATDINAVSETRTVTITVSAVDDALDDAFATPEDTVLNEDVSTNDGFAGLVTYAINAASANGVTALAGDGTFSYTPNADFNGADSFTYDVTDVNGAVETQTVTITVGGADDAQDDAFATPEDTVLNEDVSTNDSFAGAVTYTVNADVSNGTLVLAANGTFTYTPNADFNGTDTFTYDATDVVAAVETQTVTITVGAVDDAQDDAFATPEDTVLNEDVSTNDTFTGAVTYTVNADVSNGTLVLAASGTFTYTPALNFNGADNFTYDATDVNGAVETRAVTLSVGATNDNPLAVDDAYVTAEDTPLSVVAPGVLGNDSDVDLDTITVTANTAPASGVATVNPDGSFLYTPNADFNGSDSFSYTVEDGVGGFDTGTVLISVTGVNDIPVAQDDSGYVMDEDDDVLLIPVLDNDYLAEGPTTITAVGVDGDTESPPTTVLNESGDPISAPNGFVTVVGNTIEYEPKQHFYGDDFFTYTITDVDGDTATATVFVTVNPVNDPPTGVQYRNYTIIENGALTVDATSGLLADAYDVDGALLDGSGNPVGESITLQQTLAPPVGTLLLDNITGAFEYTPPVNFTGEVTFAYRLFDGQDFSTGDDYVVKVRVNPAVVPPAPPPAGEVVVTFDLADVPLEQASGVSPNVIVMMDDSGSMDWNTIVQGDDQNGGFVIDNNDIATSRRRSNSYVYLYDLPNNAYAPDSGNGRIVPTEEALQANTNTDNNQYGVWRARNHKHNFVYYNPELRYTPWAGQDASNQPFADAVPSAVRLNPVASGNTFDILANHTYTADNVPRWLTSGRDSDIPVTVYIPRYYATPASAPLAWNDPHLLIEIRNGTGPLPGGLFPGGPNREDCAVGDGNPLNCTYDQEIQNFANWFQYYRSREYVSKNGIGKVVEQIQDIRLGYETINDRVSTPVREMNDLPTEGNKRDLLEDIYSVDSFSGTPLRQALERAGEIFSCNAGDCPALPAPEGFCQQNFTLLFSDGYWNGNDPAADDEDADGTGPWDGGRYADGIFHTLADVAMHYYETDIQPGLDDEVPPTERDRSSAPAGTFPATGATMHQHMKTFTIAFGVTGTVDQSTIPSTPTTPFAWPDAFAGPLEKVDDMLHTAINGRGRFLNASDPETLRSAFDAAFDEFTQAASSTSSAAFNSTSLREGTLLYRGFYDLSDNTGELTATIVFADGTLKATPEWLASEQLDPANKLPANRRLVTFDPLVRQGMPFRFASLNLNQQAAMNAQEVDYIRGVRTAEDPSGPLRQRDLTGALLGDIVNSSPVFVGSPRSLNRDQAPYPVDDLYSEFVDDYKDRLPVVYVGANDGILHGFQAQTGEELFGYVPNKILDGSEAYRNLLADFTSPFYQHQYYVDLTPRLNDVYMRAGPASPTRSWNTVLIGGLGSGGKGFFALNVNDPDSLVTSEAATTEAVLWEFTDSDDTYPVDAFNVPLGGAVGAITDPLGNPVKDLGYSLSLPTVAMSNVTTGGAPARNEWVALFGNGPNSTAGIAKLFVLFMDRGLDGWGGANDFVKIDTGFGVQGPPHALAGYPNGLGSPTAIDRDLNGTVDWVYAGDRLGNLFRFDLTDPNPDNWTSTRLFTASYDDGGTVTVQPILSQPLVIKHPTEQGFLVVFGTGSYIARDDADDESIQSIYAIWDRGEGAPATALPDSKALRLVPQTITNVVDDSVFPPVTRRIISKDPVNYQVESGVPGTYGWYIDLNMPRATNTISGAANLDGSGRNPPDAQFPGERAIRRLLFRDGTIITTTVLPSLDDFSCFGTRPGSILLFDAVTGGDPGRAVVDFNRDGTIDLGDMVTVAGEVYAAGILFDQTDLDGSLVDLSTLGGEGDTDFLFVSGGNETISYRIDDINDSRTGRLSWRELDMNQ